MSFYNPNHLPIMKLAHAQGITDVMGCCMRGELFCLVTMLPA